MLHSISVPFIRMPDQSVELFAHAAVKLEYASDAFGFFGVELGKLRRVCSG